MQSGKGITFDQLIAELARLKQRVDDLEKAAFTDDSYVEGWSRAAKIVGVNAITCKRRYESGDFPKPCRIDTINRSSGEPHERPTWRKADLIAYAEGK
jgi:hypothetical protein